MSKLDPDRSVSGGELPLSLASARRLSLYLRSLETFRREGAPKVSSGQLGETLGVSDAQVRKDLGSLGNLGHPGIGCEWKAVMVGVGNLARALIRYRGFQQQGFRLVALCDIDPSKIGEKIEGLTVQPLGELASVVRAAGAELGIVTVPAEA